MATKRKAPASTPRPRKNKKLAKSILTWTVGVLGAAALGIYVFNQIVALF